MKLSIIIVSFEVRDFLLNCLSSIFQNPPDTDFEVICVENGSMDGTAHAVKERFPTVRLVCNEANFGWTRGCNQGFTEATGDYLLLLDPDTLVLPGTLNHLIGFLQSNPGAGCVGPKTLYPDGSLQLSCRNFPDLKFAIYHTLGIHKVFPNHPAVTEYYLHDWDHQGARRVDMVNTNCVMFRKEMLEEVGVFDERFFAHFGDNDWFYRILQSPWEVWFVGGAKIIHYASRSTQKVLYRQVVVQQRDLHRYYRKHHAEEHHWLLQMTVLIGICVRTGIFAAANLLRREKSLYSHPRGWR